MRFIVKGNLQSKRTYTVINKKTMTSVETGEKLDRKYYIMQQTDVDKDLDIAWNKIDIEAYEDYNLNNEAESGYELIRHLKDKNVFWRKDFNTFYGEVKNATN